MRFSFQQAFRAMILLLFIILIGHLHYSGDIYKLINPDYETLSGIGVFVLIILFIVQLQRIWIPQKNCDYGCSHHHDHGEGQFNFKKCIAYAIIAFPLFTGFVFPLATLDASIARNRGVMLSLTSNALRAEEQEEIQFESTAPPVDETHSYDTPADPNLYSNTVTEDEYQNVLTQLDGEEQIIMDEQVYSTYYEAINVNMDDFSGREITTNGFVYTNEDFSANQRVIGRFLITHCIADASFIGFLTEFDEAPTLTEDTWVKLTGEIEIQDYEGVRLPVIQVRDWVEIDEPNQPYVYPLNIRIR